jgi:hypothetical protein
VKLHVDLESLQLIEGPGFRNPVTALRFKRGDAANLEVTFLRNGTTPEAIGDPAALELRFGIKPRNRFDVGYLVHTDAWTLPAVDAENPIYQCAPSFNTTELNSSLNVGSTTATELSEITLMGEITWREGSGEPTSTRTFAVIVENDVNRGDEGVPTDAEPAYPAPGSLATSGDLAIAIAAHLAAEDPHPNYLRHDAPESLTDTQRTIVRTSIAAAEAPPAILAPMEKVSNVWYPASHVGEPTNSQNASTGGTPGWLGRIAIAGGDAWICLQNNLTPGNSGWRRIVVHSMDPQITAVTFNSYELPISFGFIEVGRSYRIRMDNFTAIPVENESFGITFINNGFSSIGNIVLVDSAYLTASLLEDASFGATLDGLPSNPSDLFAEFTFTAGSTFEWSGVSSYGLYGSGYEVGATITITPL